jgi:DNA-directed RNA polymerase subunit K/omega
MSSRSELVAQAQGKISNPFVLCTVVGKRIRQCMASGNPLRSTAEIVDYALGELVAGLLKFEMKGQIEPKSIDLPLCSQANPASSEIVEVQAR